MLPDRMTTPGVQHTPPERAMAGPDARWWGRVPGLPGALLMAGWLLGPWAAPALAAPWAYIPNAADATVSVIDTAANRVIATVPLKPRSDPWGVAVHPAGTRVYVTNYADASVSVIDTVTHTVIATVPVTLGPVGVTVHPFGTRAYVTSAFDRNIAVLDTATNTVIDPAAGALDLPQGIALRVQGANAGSQLPSRFQPMALGVQGANSDATEEPGEAYVVEAGSNRVSVLNLVDNTVRTVPVGNLPYGVATDPAGTRAYVTNNLDNSVSVIDTVTHTVLATIPVGAVPSGVAVHPTGPRAYVTNYRGNTISVINTDTNQEIATVPVAGLPSGLAVHPAGTLVYVVNTQQGTVSAINTATHQVDTTIPVGSRPVAFGQFIGPLLPGLSFSLNQGSFHRGDVHIVEASVYALDPGPILRPVEVSVDRVSSSQRVDAYVAVQLPDGTKLFLQADGTLTTAFQPVLKNWAVVAVSGELLRYTFRGTEPSGRYTWLGAFFEPGTLKMIGMLARASFTFSP